MYIDKKCVQARVPMIDSGTLGPKGHVQVVKPMETESYGSTQDPETETEIPHCTLKMFPEETLHCVEWAKDLFENWFTLDPQSFNKFLFAGEIRDLDDSQTQQVAKKVYKMAKKTPTTFEDCLAKARRKFNSFFANKVLELLHAYPVDKMTKEGRPFWSLPKRAPHIIEFDPQNEIHASFIASYACLYANLYKLDVQSAAAEFLDDTKNPRSRDSRLKMALHVADMKVKKFVPNEEKTKAMQEQVEKEKDKDKDAAKEEGKNEGSSLQDDKEEIQQLQKNIEKIKESGRYKDEAGELNIEEFEKDVDENFHIDFIHSMANIRAANYGLQEMDWITVKIKAGRIVPALATTTAAIAGLQTIEMLKFLKGLPIEAHRNAFLNLAVPSLMMGEPGPPQKFKLTEGIESSLWTRWEYKGATKDTKLKELLIYLEKEVHKGKLEFRDIFYSSTPIFMYALAKIQDPGITNILDCSTLSKKLVSLLEIKQGDQTEFVDLTVTFIEKGGNEEQIIKNVPDVRVYFEKA